MLSRKRRLVLLVCLVALVPVFQAQADPIVVRPLDPSRPGQYSNLGPPGEPHQQVADRFELALATTLESLVWYGRYDASYSTASPVSFLIRVFDDAAGAPAVNPGWEVSVPVNASLQGTNYLGSPWLLYSTALPGWSLGSGTFWLSIVESHLATPPYGDSQWLWGDTFGTGYRAIRSLDGTSWESGLDVNHAFTLEGTPIPEPASLLLLGTGLAGLVRWRRRRA